MATAAQRLAEYEKLFNQSQQYDPNKFQNDFESAYNQATNNNADVINQRANAVSQLQSTPAQLREQYYSSPVRNPLAQESLIAGRLAPINAEIQSLGDILTARNTRYEDILGKQLSAYTQQQQAAQTAAENAWRLYQDQLAQEEAARARAAAAAQSTSLADLFNAASQQANANQQVRVEKTKNDSNGGMINSLVDTYNAVKAQQNPIDRVGAYIKNAGWNSLNPVYGIGYSTMLLNDLFNRK